MSKLLKSPFMLFFAANHFILGLLFAAMPFVFKHGYASAWDHRNIVNALPSVGIGIGFIGIGMLVLYFTVRPPFRSNKSGEVPVVPKSVSLVDKISLGLTMILIEIAIAALIVAMTASDEDVVAVSEVIGVSSLGFCVFGGLAKDLIVWIVRKIRKHAAPTGVEAVEAKPA